MITKGGKLTTQCSENRCRNLLEDWRGALETRWIHLAGSRYDPERIVNNLPRNIRPFFMEAIQKARERHAYKREARIRSSVLQSRSREVSDLNVVLPVGCLLNEQGDGHLSDPGNCNLNEWRAFVRDHHETYDHCSPYIRDWNGYFATNQNRKEQSLRYRYWRKYPALKVCWTKVARLEEIFGCDLPQEYIDEICTHLKQDDLIIKGMWGAVCLGPDSDSYEVHVNFSGLGYQSGAVMVRFITTLPTGLSMSIVNQIEAKVDVGGY